MPVLKYCSEKEYDGYIRINSCAKQWLSDRDYDIELPHGRVDFSLRYILKGFGYCEIDGKMQQITEGSLMLHPPKMRQNYSFKKSDESIILWAHFSGTVCKTFSNLIEDSPLIIKIQDRNQFESAFEKMVVSHYKKAEYSELQSCGYMTVIISLIAQSKILINKNNSSSKNEDIEKIISIMHENYNKPINIKKYAELCCVGEDHFIRLFKNYTGLPPYNYQLRIRIDRAKDFLENTSINIRDCAETVGFDDAAYFSRVFKRFTGHPPSYYYKL